ncbi:leucyl aminopeptidase [Tolypothrix campylonemoides VB511288]|nr:leucyl aminopeptidase [Tolypothrix campylonemoides VB511288]
MRPPHVIRPIRFAPPRSTLLRTALAAALALSPLLASAQRSIAFEAFDVPATGTLAIAVTEGQLAGGAPAGGAFARIDAAGNGALRRAVAAADFKGKADTQLDLPGIAGYERVLLVGLGAQPTPRALEDFGGLAGQLGARSAAARVDVLWDGANADDAARIAFGAALGQYRFDRYKTRKPDEPATGRGALVVRTPAGAQADAAYRAQWAPVAASVAFARDLITEPANAVYPEEFVARTRKAFEGLRNVRIEVLDVPAMQRLGMGGMLSVGLGSARPPRLLLVRYDGAGRGDAPVAFVGKGITFDSGGISLKPNDGMWRMKYDMSGAATAIATVHALAGRRAKVNAVGVAALAENMPSGTASRPGDVVRTMSGKTFEIISTDAEGRMVLSDALWYVQQQDKPKAVIDIATLTGAVSTALGDDYAGLFSRDDALAERLRAAGDAAGEPLWRLPLHPSYAKDLESPIADLRNGRSGGGGAGAGLGAHFIGEWIQPGTPWAHLDIAGMAWREDAGTPTSPKGATAFGIRLLDRYVRDALEAPR